MKNWSKTEFLMLLVLALPFIYLAITWNNYPEQIPIHFNHEGVADRYGSKVFGLLFLPAINIGMYLLLKYIPRIDPRKANFALFKNRYQIIRLVIHLFLSFIFFLIAITAQKGASSLLFPKLVLIGVAVLLMIIGNYLSAVRPNYFVGVRTPWTLENEEVWKRTHRFTGMLWVISSLVFIAITLFMEEPNPVLLVGFISLIAIIPIVYSYLIYQKLTKTNHSQHIQ